MTHTTVRTPSARSVEIIPSASGNWCGLNSQVLYWVAHGESITIASSGIPLSRKPSIVVEHVVLRARGRRGSSRSRSPTRAAPSGTRSAGRTRAAAPRASGRTAAPPTAARRFARVETDDPLAGQIEPGSVRLGLQPHRVATAREQPRHGRAVALRDPALRRASRAGSQVRCSGDRRRAGRSGPPGRTACSGGRRGRRSAPPSAGPSRAPAAAARRRRASSSAIRSIVDHRHAQRRGRPPWSADPEHDPVGPARPHLTPHGPLGRRELLGGEDPLGELHEVIVDRAVRDPRAARSAAVACRRAGRSARTGAGPVSTRSAPCSRSDLLVSQRIRYVAMAA